MTTRSCVQCGHTDARKCEVLRPVRCRERAGIRPGAGGWSSHGHPGVPSPGFLAAGSHTAGSPGRALARAGPLARPCPARLRRAPRARCRSRRCSGSRRRHAAWRPVHAPAASAADRLRSAAPCRAGRAPRSQRLRLARGSAGPQAPDEDDARVRSVDVPSAGPAAPEPAPPAAPPASRSSRCATGGFQKTDAGRSSLRSPPDASPRPASRRPPAAADAQGHDARGGDARHRPAPRERSRRQPSAPNGARRPPQPVAPGGPGPVQAPQRSRHAGSRVHGRARRCARSRSKRSPRRPRRDIVEGQAASPW